MRIRTMRSSDMPGVISVYNARAATTIGFVKRSRERWRRARREKWAKTIWIVAVDGRRISGYGIAHIIKKSCYVSEVVWHPDYDTTPLGEQLLNVLIKRMKSIGPASIIMSDTGDSLTLALPRLKELKPTKTNVVFMAAVTDTSLLLKDAKRIVEKRVHRRLRLQVDKRTTTIGKGRTAPIEVSMDADTLLSLLFGVRDLTKEVKKKAVRYMPKNKESWRVLMQAFPYKKFWMQDTW